MLKKNKGKRDFSRFTYVEKVPAQRPFHVENWKSQQVQGLQIPCLSYKYRHWGTKGSTHFCLVPGVELSHVPRVIFKDGCPFSQGKK